MRLVNKAGMEVRVGFALKFEGKYATIVYMPQPHKPASSGKVTCKFEDGTEREYYAGVFGLEWIEREDRV